MRFLSMAGLQNAWLAGFRQAAYIHSSPWGAAKTAAEIKPIEPESG
jgi:hypothetical protein